MTRWRKKEVLEYFCIKAWSTIRVWQRERLFPLGVSYVHGGPILFDVQAVKRWAKKNETEQFVEGRSKGERPKYNLPENEPADAGA